MSNINETQIDLETKAFNDGRKYVEEVYIPYYTQQNLVPPIPKWPEGPKSQEEYYFRRGVSERFTEITKIDLNQEKRLSKKNHTLATHKNGKPRPNALDREIKRLGPDFLSKYGDRYFQEVKNLSERILRDLSNSNINIPDYEEYFRSDRLLDSLISVSKAKANYHSFVAKALYFYGANASQSLQGLMPSDFGPVENRFQLYHDANAQIYTILLNALVEFKSYLMNGIFSPEIIHVAETTIYNKKLVMAARDPYEQRRR